MQKIYSTALAVLCAFSVQSSVPKNSVTPGKRTYPSTISAGINQRGGGVTCDTLQNFAPTDSLTIYTDPDGGYVSGQNSYGDLAKAEKYTGVTAGSSVGTLLVLFGVATAANPTDTFTVNLWDNTAGEPSSILASANYTYQMAADDVSAQSISVINFAAPAIVDTSFFGGVAFDYTAGDTIAIVSSQDLSVVPATAWELFADGTTWVPFDNPQSWGLTVAHVILPVVCSTTGIASIDYDSKLAVYPTITSEKINLLIAPSDREVSVSILDLNGRMVSHYSFNTLSQHQHSIDVAALPEGTYLVQMTSGNAISTRKFVVNR